jgi:hypothetical protein
VTAPLRFEVLRFSATPASADVALLELEGRFRAPVRRRLGAPRLLAEEGTVRIEVGAADGGDATAEPDGVRWRASFAVPLRLLESGTFALAVGRELLVDLPEPDSEEHSNGSSDLHVRLAREANGLRQRADEAREAAAAALARADAERDARERLEAELRGERHAREELATRLAQFETELASRDAAVEALRSEHEAELERREQAFRARIDERVAEAEAESAELRRTLKTARADIELLRRERDRANDRAASSARTVPAPSAPPLPAGDERPHPEQDRATPALPLPEGEAVGAARPASPRDPDPETGTDRDGDTDSETRVHDERSPAPATAAAAAAASERTVAPYDTTETLAPVPNGALNGDETESVRVLGRRPPRTRSGNEPPGEPLPGTAEIGARHIVPGALGRGGVGPWLARLAAILALAVVVAAVLLVVWGVR